MYPGHTLQEVAHAVERRTSETDALLGEMERPSRLPVSIAIVEIQIRYFLDDRIVTRSLDGLIDPELLRFYHAGHYDHVGYLKARDVQYLLQYPNPNADRARWSLAEVGKLKPGEALEREGLRFVRLTRNATRVERLGR
jgi:hypothetical protein